MKNEKPVVEDMNDVSSQKAEMNYRNSVDLSIEEKKELVYED